MTISGLLPVLLIGTAGGLIGELLKWYQLRESPNLPAYLKGPRYWVTTLLMAVVGGAYAALYGIGERDALLVANIGLTAPLVLKSVVSGATSDEPVLRGGPVDRDDARVLRRPTLRSFLAGR